MDIGKTILKYRSQLGLSQEQLAEEIGATAFTIAMWETGQAHPTEENLLTLAEIFDISVEQLRQNVVDEQAEKPLFRASTKYSPDIYQRATSAFTRKNITIDWIGIASSIIFMIGLLLSEVDNVAIVLPIFLLIIFVSSIIRIKKAIKSSGEVESKNAPNLQGEYLFYEDHFVYNIWSDNSTATFSKKYSELTTKLHDEKYVYIMFDKRYAVIDKDTCREHLDKLSQLIGLPQNQTRTRAYEPNTTTTPTMSMADVQKPKKKWISALMIVLFVLSFASLFIALMLMAIARALSPLPEFALVTTEYMWMFYLVIPIPATSVVLGFVFKRKGYRTTKNIVAGIIMIVILFIYGSFTAAFDPKISHDMQYVEELSQEIGLEVPTDGYVSVSYESSHDCESFAMVKVTDEQEPDFVARLQSSFYWKRDTSFIPANALGAYELASTSNYEYFAVYNTTTNSYNNFTGKLIYLSYDVETNILYVYCYK